MYGQLVAGVPYLNLRAAGVRLPSEPETTEKQSAPAKNTPCPWIFGTAFARERPHVRTPGMLFRLSALIKGHSASPPDVARGHEMPQSQQALVQDTNN